MKFLLAIFCSLLAYSIAMKDNCKSLRMKATNGKCEDGPQVLECSDPCRIDKNITAENCASFSYCCLKNGRCLMKVAEVELTSEVTVGKANVLSSQLSFLLAANAPKPPTTTAGTTTTAPTIEVNTTGPGRSGNIFSPGGGQYTPYYPPPNYCLQFPQTCIPPQGQAAYQALIAPINIPYCQRIACNPSNPYLESNFEKCIAEPGCYFDNELSNYRKQVGQAILPGVPVCHKVIRNKAFAKRAVETAAKIGGKWTPLLTACVLKEYHDEIFGEHIGCKYLDYLQFFGHRPKLAGWQGIDKRGCELIGACYVRDGADRFRCVYPADSLGRPTIRANQAESTNRQLSANLFGQPQCYQFDDSTDEKFLASYHICLATGCAVNVNRKTVIDKLLAIGNSLPYSIRFQYRNKVLSGEARPHNYKKIIEQLRNPVPNCGGGLFGLLGNGGGLPGNGGGLPGTGGGYPSIPPPIIPFSFTLKPNGSSATGFSGSFPSGGFGGFPSGGVGGYPSGGVGGFPSGGIGGFPSGGVGGLPSGGVGGLPNGGGYPPIFPPVIPRPPANPCPYVKQKLHYPGLPPLTGSFSGCCAKPRCYLPKSDLYSAVTSISWYLSLWSDWTECSKKCGGGKQKRTRECIGKYCNTNDPNLLLLQTRDCNQHLCPHWGSWRSWTTCSKTCGSGSRSRERTCRGVGKCVGEGKETRLCRTGKCPQYTSGPWSECSNKCGKGTRTRQRICSNAGAYGCPGNTVENGQCEHFCGENKLSCNEQTCCFQSRCRQANGLPGYCTPATDPRINTRCYKGTCAQTWYLKPPCTGYQPQPLPFSLNVG